METRAMKTSLSNDVYFLDAYANMYLQTGDILRRFKYSDGGESFELLFIMRPIVVTGNTFYDIETPYGYGGPLSTTDDESFLLNAWTAFGEFAASEKIIAGFFRFHPLLKNENLAHSKFIKVEYMRPTVMLNLNQSEEEVLRGYRSDTRDRIRKALKNGIEIERSKSIEALKRFGDHYRQRMIGLGADDFYLFNDDYFQKFYDTLQESYTVYTAFHQGASIGGAIVMKSDCFSHLHLSAVDIQSQSLGAAHLLRHTAIMDALGKQDTFHFGGGSTNSEEDTLYQFKAGFSPERAMFYIGKALFDDDIYQKACGEWAKNNPQKAEKYKTYFLKYRM